MVQTPAAAAAAAAAAPNGPKEWVGLQSMPAATQQGLMEALNVLRAQNQTEMTVVFVGKQGAGKSSTLNSVLNERVAQSAPFQPESLRPLLASRQAAGFTVSFLDTPGLLEGDQVSQRGLASVKLAMKDRTVHAVVFMDRLDGWRVDNSDRAVFKALDEHFGREIWKRTILGFSHGQLSPPNSMNYEEYVAGRAATLRKAVRDTLGDDSLVLPHAVVENGSMDGWRVDNSDRAVFKALDEHFGREIWKRTILGFSHGQLSPPNSMNYEEYVAGRAATLRKAVRDTLGDDSLVLPHAVVENGSRCATNGGGEKVLPDAGRTVWLTRFVKTLVDVAKKGTPLAFDPEKNYAAGTDTNKKGRLLVFPLLALQTLVLRPLLVRQIRKDVKSTVAGGRV